MRPTQGFLGDVSSPSWSLELLESPIRASVEFLRNAYIVDETSNCFPRPRKVFYNGLLMPHEAIKQLTIWCTSPLITVRKAWNSGFWSRLPRGKRLKYLQFRMNPLKSLPKRGQNRLQLRCI